MSEENMRHQVSRVFKEVAGASVGWAVFMIFLGLLAVVLTRRTEIMVSVIIAWIAILSGLAYVISATGDWHAGALIWRLLIGLLYMAVGGYVAFHPRIAIEALGLLIASIFSVESILEFVTFFQIRPYAGSVWALFDAIFTLLMAFVLVLPWPDYSYWTVGIILGINLVITGSSVLIYSLATRKAVERLS
jgi:uncharacterized membrane protein HdeD (DUF308 family)